MRGAGGGWRESMELSEELREGVGRAETTSCACGFAAGECIADVGEREDELPEGACALCSSVAGLDASIFCDFVCWELFGPALAISGNPKRSMLNLFE